MSLLTLQSHCYCLPPGGPARHSTTPRLADTTADECLAAGLCTSEDIELHFGWRLKIHKKSMLLHYAGRGKRSARAKVVKGI